MCNIFVLVHIVACEIVLIIYLVYLVGVFDVEVAHGEVGRHSSNDFTVKYANAYGRSWFWPLSLHIKTQILGSLVLPFDVSYPINNNN